jgi:hypothetical protein
MTVINNVLAKQAKTKKITGPRYGWKLASMSADKVDCGWTLRRRRHTANIKPGRIETKPDIDHVFSDFPDSIIPFVEGVEGMPEPDTNPSAHVKKEVETDKMNIAANMRIINCQSIARSDLQSAQLYSLTYMTNTLPARNQNARLLIS